ncbi:MULTISPECIES: hypothetical protein [unclassified Sphingomonas]|uniref:hypothetical protein n=1 Tax=unclassified Sphingomonas TaxID=196159 RepID=UPI00285E2444|nr:MULTISPECIES: hypothetical protein [unclassified Sphingomonas]MDR6114394.1 hypothetical protein [Sphingomonas sp. SORGH_AS_0789]MDR6148246.1 hypothetical protein [Sphingomonas sp. SORGH_AS_0742]
MKRVCFALVLAMSSVTASAASDGPVESWGKPGIGFAQYRADAIECAKTGYFRDVSQDEPAKRFIRGFETADRLLNFPSASESDSWGDSVRRTQPDRQKRDLQAIQVGNVEQCLTGKGYHRFTLTRAEVKTLSRYPRGSEARRQYLYSLAAR